MNKKQLSERDICTKFITPALEQAGWDIDTQIREKFPLTKGRIIVRGKLHTRAQHKRADYVLFYKPNIPLADPDFDGDPVQVYTPKHPDYSPVPPDDTGDEAPGGGLPYPEQEESEEGFGMADSGPDDEGPKVRRYVVANVEVKVAQPSASSISMPMAN